MSEGERIPCADDLCTGTIGDSGVCSYCGKGGSGGLVPSSGLEAEHVTEGVGGAGAGAGAGLDDERVPCSDDLCTGTIGAGGVCNYCGKPARSRSL